MTTSVRVRKPKVFAKREDAAQIEIHVTVEIMGKLEAICPPELSGPRKNNARILWSINELCKIYAAAAHERQERRKAQAVTRTV